MNFMIVFDIILIVLALYLFIAAFNAKKNKKMSSAFVPEGKEKMCKDSEGMVKAMFPKMIIFAAVTLIFGIESIINDLVVSLPYVITITLCVAFLGTWFWFSAQLKKAFAEYYSMM